MTRILRNVLLLLMLVQASVEQLHAININIDSAKVSLITCSPGRVVYERFGHTAIRVQDPSQQIDLVFNYGLFNFNQKDFYIKFVKGDTDYSLGAYEFRYFLPEYIKRNSSVWEQQLELNLYEKTRLINALLINNQPENREYRYNFIFDNCSTRPRDLIMNCLDGPIRLSTDSVSQTFRKWVRDYVGYDDWVMVGIDLIFGSHADRVATRKEAMFLPEVLMREYGQAYLAHAAKPLVVSTEGLYLRTAAGQVSASSLLSTTFIASMVLALVIGLSFWEWKTHRCFRWLDTVVLLGYGMIGVAVFFLMFFSSHPLMQGNFNLLWLHPLHLLALVALWVPQWSRWYTYYMLLVLVASVAVLIIFFIGWQTPHAASLALVGILLIRALARLFNRCEG